MFYCFIGIVVSTIKYFLLKKLNISNYFVTIGVSSIDALGERRP
jgi:hypothetical protein